MTDDVYRMKRPINPAEFNGPSEGAEANFTGTIPPAMQQAIQEQQKQSEFPRNVPFGVTKDSDLNDLLSVLTTQNYEPVSLPSLGKFYTDPILKTGKLHVRPMTGREETILTSGRHMRSNRGLDNIFQNCIQERISPEKLLLSDRTYLLIYLRAISYSNIYEANIKCPVCSHSFDNDIDLNLNVNYCPDNLTEADLVKVLPKSGFSVKYRYMTGQDETSITAYRERKIKNINATDDSFLYKASLAINEISNGNSHITDQHAILALLDKLAVADVNFIRNLIDEPFGVETKIDITCPSCLSDFKTELPFGASFFFPQEKQEPSQ